MVIGCRHLPLAPAGDQCHNAEEHPVQTEDGARIHLHRHRAAGPPVLVVHGIAANARSWDLTADRSLAVALQRAGYDAWLLDLRGHGQAHQDLDGKEQRSGWTMTDYARYDIPAAIQAIRQHTNATTVGYVGHSMGGMIAAIYNDLYGDAAIGAMVIVASPIDFGAQDPLLELAVKAIGASRAMRTLPAPMISRMTAGWDRLPMHADDLLWSKTNLSTAAKEKMFRAITSPLSRRELNELQGVLRSGVFPAAASLPTLTTPLLVIAGRADRIAPADRVEPFFLRAGSETKRYVLAGRANGFLHDYGHADLVVGDDAHREIYPRIVDWFDQVFDTASR